MLNSPPTPAPMDVVGAPRGSCAQPDRHAVPMKAPLQRRKSRLDISLVLTSTDFSGLKGMLSTREKGQRPCLRAYATAPVA